MMPFRDLCVVETSQVLELVGSESHLCRACSFLGHLGPDLDFLEVLFSHLKNWLPYTSRCPLALRTRTLFFHFKLQP